MDLHAQLRHIVTVTVTEEKHEDHYEYVNDVIERKVYKKWYHWFIGKYDIVVEPVIGWTSLLDWYHESEGQVVYTEEQLNSDGFIIRGESVYKKSQVYITFLNKQSHVEKFDTEYDLKVFLKPILDQTVGLVKIL